MEIYLAHASCFNDQTQLYQPLQAWELSLAGPMTVIKKLFVVIKLIKHHHLHYIC